MYLSPGSQQRGVAGSPAPLSGIGTRRQNHVEEKNCLSVTLRKTTGLNHEQEICLNGGMKTSVRIMCRKTVYLNKAQGPFAHFSF